MRAKGLAYLLVYASLLFIAAGAVGADAAVSWPNVTVSWNGTAATIYVSSLPLFRPNSTIMNVYFVNVSTLRITWECLVPPCAPAVANVSCLYPVAGGTGVEYGVRVYEVRLGFSPRVDPSTHIYYDIVDVDQCYIEANVTLLVAGRVYNITVRAVARRSPALTGGIDLVNYALAGLVMMLAYTRNRRQMGLGLLVFSIASSIVASVVGVSDPTAVYMASVMAGVFGAIFLII